MIGDNYSEHLAKVIQLHGRKKSRAISNIKAVEQEISRYNVESQQEFNIGYARQLSYELAETRKALDLREMALSRAIAFISSLEDRDQKASKALDDIIELIMV